MQEMQDGRCCPCGNRPNRCVGIMHRIEQGDTLYRLGKKYQVSVAAILFANPYVDAYNLQVGDELCIPLVKR